MDAKQKTDQPRMDQPSREAMAGKLLIYADREQIFLWFVSRFQR